jgi:hypothetical protein
MTQLIGPHYTKTYKLRIQILILKSIELLGSLKHVINIILQIRYMGCYSFDGLEHLGLLTFASAGVAPSTGGFSDRNQSMLESTTRSFTEYLSLALDLVLLN